MRVTRRGRTTFLLTGFVATAACGVDTTGGREPGESALADIPMSGEAEVPPVQSQGSGTARTSLVANLLRVTGSFRGLTSDLAAVEGSPAHVHDGPAGSAGPIVFDLEVTPGEDRRSGTFDGERLLDQEQLSAFQSGRYYVNVHTAAHPPGELRGQLIAE